MNVKDDVVIWPKHYKKIPEPFFVVRCNEHFLVCELDKEGYLIEEHSVVHWNKYQVRKWALNIVDNTTISH